MTPLERTAKVDLVWTDPDSGEFSWQREVHEIGHIEMLERFNSETTPEDPEDLPDYLVRIRVHIGEHCPSCFPLEDAIYESMKIHPVSYADGRDCTGEITHHVSHAWQLDPEIYPNEWMVLISRVADI